MSTIMSFLKWNISPRFMFFNAMKSVAMKDGLPKFKDLPTDFGGSGKVLPE